MILLALNHTVHLTLTFSWSAIEGQGFPIHNTFLGEKAILHFFFSFVGAFVLFRSGGKIATFLSGRRIGT